MPIRSGGRITVAGCVALSLISGAAIADAADPPRSPPSPAQAPTASAIAPATPASQANAPDAQSISSGLPALQPGWWEFHRTQTSSLSGGKPKTTTSRKCIAPTTELDRNLSDLQRRGCVLTPFEHHANRHEAKWRCDAGNGRMLEMHEIITINGPTSYKIENQARADNETSQSTTLVNRLGECPPVPASPPHGPHPR